MANFDNSDRVNNGGVTELIGTGASDVISLDRAFLLPGTTTGLIDGLGGFDRLELDRSNLENVDIAGIEETLLLNQRLVLIDADQLGNLGALTVTNVYSNSIRSDANLQLNFLNTTSPQAIAVGAGSALGSGEWLSVTTTGQSAGQQFALDFSAFTMAVDARLSYTGGDADEAVTGTAGNDTLLGEAGDDTLTGGAGADMVEGGAGSDRIIVGSLGDGTGDTITGGEDPGGADVDILDLTGAGVQSIVYDTSDPTFDPVTGSSESGVVTFDDGGTLTFSEIESVIPCFTPGTLIATAIGERPVEDLQVGDRIITRDNGIQPIVWLGATQVTGAHFARLPNLRPVLVMAGALGHGLPERDMMLSPNHKVLFANERTDLMYHDAEVFVAAKHLVGQPGIRAADVTKTTYIHFMFENHEVVLSDGSWSESFHPGHYTINGIGAAARREILALFPHLASTVGRRGYRQARQALRKHEARLLIR